MRWLVTGAGGMLGRDVTTTLLSVGEQVTALGHSGLDICDMDAVRRLVHRHQVVVNTAAWTDVDAAETHPKQADLVNGTGPANLAIACQETGAVLVHISSNYVFSGEAHTPYPEGARVSPINAYGRSKVLGELEVTRLHPTGGFVLRTAWLYGVGGGHGGGFAAKMLRMARSGQALQVVNDQIGQPTWTRDLARRIWRVGVGAERGSIPPGIYHATSDGYTTRSGWVEKMLTGVGMDPGLVTPVPSSQFPRPARCPMYSVLGHAGWADAGLKPMDHWEASLHRALPHLTPYWV